MQNENNIYLSVVIPARNEEEKIGKTLEVIYSYLNKKPFVSEIIVCENNSTDNTASIVEQKIKEIKNLRILKMKEPGKGATVQKGMLDAKGQIRLFTDADNSTDISHFDKIEPLFNEGFDVVIGSRNSWDVPGAIQAVSQSFVKRLGGILGNLFIQFLVLPGIWDTQCGFKAFKKEAAEKIFSKTLIKKWGFDVEALALARRFGFKIGIVPVYWINNPASKVNLKTYFQVLKETIEVRLNLWLKKYD